MLGYCCKCSDEEHLDSVVLTCDEEHLDSAGDDLHSVIAVFDDFSQPVQRVTEATEWQPPWEHRVVFEADLHRRKTATELLRAFRHMVDAELFSAEPTSVLAADLEARHFSSDDTLVRHLMYCDGDEQKTMASLKATLQWRAKFLDGKGNTMVGEGVASKKACQCCIKDPRAHCFLHMGTDAAGQHVFYSCAGASTNKKPLDFCKHLALELERIFDGNSAPGCLVWIVNLAGFGIADCNPQNMTMGLPIFLTHYAERFSQVILWNMPTIFHGVYSASMRLLDPIKKERVLVHRTEAERMRYAEAYWSNNAEMAAWLDAASHLKGTPGKFPDMSLSCQLGDTETQTILRRCAALTTK